MWYGGAPCGPVPPSPRLALSHRPSAIRQRAADCLCQMKQRDLATEASEWKAVKGRSPPRRNVGNYPWGAPILFFLPLRSIHVHTHYAAYATASVDPPLCFVRSRLCPSGSRASVELLVPTSLSLFSRSAQPPARAKQDPVGREKKWAAQKGLAKAASLQDLTDLLTISRDRVAHMHMHMPCHAMPCHARQYREPQSHCYGLRRDEISQSSQLARLRPWANPTAQRDSACSARLMADG